MGIKTFDLQVFLHLPTDHPEIIPRFASLLSCRLYILDLGICMGIIMAAAELAFQEIVTTNEQTHLLMKLWRYLPSEP